MARILKRCDICGGWQAIYLVTDADGKKLRVCARCWKEKFAPKMGKEG